MRVILAVREIWNVTEIYREEKHLQCFIKESFKEETSFDQALSNRLFEDMHWLEQRHKEYVL